MDSFLYDRDLRHERVKKCYEGVKKTLEMLYTILYHFYNLKNVKNTHGKVSLLSN